MARKKVGRIIKDFIDKAKARKKARKRGRKMPDAKMTSRLTESLSRKQAQSVSLKKLVPRTPHSLEDFVKQVSLRIIEIDREQKMERIQYAARIATKYALDAIGLSPVHDAVKRKAVHNIVQGYFSQFERYYLLHAGEETVIRDAKKFLRELSKTLGVIKARRFFSYFFSKYFVLFDAFFKSI